LDSLAEKLQKLSNVEANISNALNLSKFTGDIYQYTTTSNLFLNIKLAEDKLSVINDKRGALQLGNTKLPQKLKELDNALNLSGFLVSVADRYKTEGARIKEDSKDLLSLISSNVESLIYNIDSLTSRIKSDLDERKKNVSQTIGSIVAVTVVAVVLGFLIHPTISIAFIIYMIYKCF
jgi:hypothetical protein